FPQGLFRPGPSSSAAGAAGPRAPGPGPLILCIRMIPVSALLLAVQSWAQIKGSLPDAPLPELPVVPVAEQAPAVDAAAPLPALGSPLPLAPLSELPAHQAVAAPQPVAAPAPARRDASPLPVRAVPTASAARAEVASELRGVRIDQASAGDA